MEREKAGNGFVNARPHCPRLVTRPFIERAGKFSEGGDTARPDTSSILEGGREIICQRKHVKEIANE
jgi:hypothetical protein